jgi:DNA-binding transcriptional ArsR family regulator
VAEGVRATGSPLNGDADVAAVAGLIGEPARASLLLALAESPELSAGELAARAGIAASTASGHLARLTAARLVVAKRAGRQRLFRLADPTVADALEALAAIAPRRPVRSLREAHVGEALRRARTCYDHLAGRLGVELTAALARDGVVVDGEQPRLGPAAPERLDALGIDLSSLESGRRPLVRTCLDWSERRPHLAGAVGAALATRLFELGWIERRPANRSVAVTTRGRLALREEFGLDVDAFH